MKRAKKHRKRHVLPGPAGLLQQRSNALENGIKVPSPNQRNEQTLVHDEVRSKKQKSNLSHAQIWDAMCLSMNRIVPACSNLGILRRALSPEYSLLAEVANAQYLKIKKLVVQIEAIHSHGHSDYTVDLSDESTRMLSTTIPRHGGAEYSSSVPIGWLSQSLIQMHPEWIKLGTVMLCHDVTVAVFRSNKGLIDRMILLGDENVVYAWTDDSVHMTTLGEQGKFSEDEKYLRLLERRAEVEERLRGSIPPDYVSENGSSCCESEEEEEDVEILDPDRNDILVVGAASNEGSEWLEISEPVQMGIQQNQKQHLNRMDNIIQSSLKEKENDANQESQTEVPSHTVQEETLQTSLTNMNSTSAHSRNVGSNTPSNQVQIDDAMTDAMKNIDRRDLIPEHASSINLRSSGTIQTTHQRKVVNPYSKAKGVLPSRPLDTVETDMSVRSMNDAYSMNQTHIVNPYARKVIQSTPTPQPSTNTEREQVTREISTTSRVQENHARQTNQTSNASSNPANMPEKIGKISTDSYHRDNDHEHISEQTQRKIHGSNWDLIAQEIDDKDAFDENIVDQSHDVSSESQRTAANDQILASQNSMGRSAEASYIFNGIDKIEDCDLDAFSEYD